MSDTNLGVHSLPCRKNCTCSDCTIEKLERRIADLLKIKTALQAELAALKAAQRWIPCSEELPPLDTPVLVQSNPYADCITITCAMRYDDGDGWLWGQLTGYNPILNRPESYEFDDDYDYLAWMPLPTPPAGQEERASKGCDHSGWSLERNGRRCVCGALMQDFGD